MNSDFRKYRVDQKTRNLFAETRILPADLIHPLFIVEGQNIRREIRSLAGISQLSADEALRETEDLLDRGIDKLLLFSVPDENLKDETGSRAYLTDNLAAKAIYRIKEKFPEVIVMTDICLCSYTSHGHCGVISGSKVDHEATVPLLAMMALTHAEAGADIVAPSAMMDKQVWAIRNLLNEKGYREVKILSYAAKYASGFYGPFREAADSTPAFGDRKSYQLDYRNTNQALEEMKADISEGADMLMVKPAHTYLDIIKSAKTAFRNIKIAGYHVSGEYMLLKAASEAGVVNEIDAFREVLTSIKRAGADLIITYYKPDKNFF